MKVKVATNERIYTGFYLNAEKKPVNFTETFKGTMAAFCKDMSKKYSISPRKVFVEKYESRRVTYEIDPEIIVKYGQPIIGEKEGEIE